MCRDFGSSSKISCPRSKKRIQAITAPMSVLRLDARYGVVFLSQGHQPYPRSLQGNFGEFDSAPRNGLKFPSLRPCLERKACWEIQ